MAEARTTLTLGALVGRNVLRLREQQGWTQDRFAVELRRHGLNWTRSMLAKVERGERGVSLEQVILLALAFEFVVPGQLLDGDEWVELSPQARIRASQLAVLLGGRTPDWVGVRDEDLPDDFGEYDLLGSSADYDLPLTRGAVGILTRAERAEWGRDGRRWPDLTDNQRVGGYLLASGDVEGRAADRLGVEPKDVALGALALWGHSLTVERERRLEGASTGDESGRRAQRGHMTRKLLEELREELERRGLRPSPRGKAPRA